MLMALFQQNVINTLLLYTANYTIPKCHREMAALSGNAQEHMLPYGGDSLHGDHFSVCRRPPSPILLLFIKQAPWKVSRKREKQKKMAKHFCPTFGTRTPASGEEIGRAHV